MPWDSVYVWETDLTIHTKERGLETEFLLYFTRLYLLPPYPLTKHTHTLSNMPLLDLLVGSRILASSSTFQPKDLAGSTGILNHACNDTGVAVTSTGITKPFLICYLGSCDSIRFFVFLKDTVIPEDATSYIALDSMDGVKALLSGHTLLVQAKPAKHGEKSISAAAVVALGITLILLILGLVAYRCLRYVFYSFSYFIVLRGDVDCIRPNREETSRV
jgi:hypothetical protein